MKPLPERGPAGQRSIPPSLAVGEDGPEPVAPTPDEDQPNGGQLTAHARGTVITTEQDEQDEGGGNG